MIPLLVVSCDAYADLWDPFFLLFDRYWPDCPFPVFLGTNEKSFHRKSVCVVQSGPDRSWASCVRAMLDQLPPSPYVLLMLDDFFLTRKVDTARVQHVIDAATARSAACLRLYSILPPPRPHPESAGFGLFLPGDDYRVTAQASLWRVDALKYLLVPGFSAWQFELVGNQLHRRQDEFLGVDPPALVYDHVIEKGKWRAEGLEICRREGILVDPAVRPAQTEDDRIALAGNARDRWLVEQRRMALEGFRAGSRAEGARRTLACLARRPFSAALWGLLMSGIAGPGLFRWSHLLHVKCTVAMIALRYRISAMFTR